jgi:hypothetical protein
MKIVKYLILPILLLTTILFTGCEKEGAGGQVDLSVYVKHHKDLIPNAVVYIKYGAKEFPGRDSKLYDDKIIVGSEGHHNGHGHFKGLRKGNYYLYSVGYDAAIKMAVEGGIPVEIRQKAGEVMVDVPVSEEH